MVFMNQVLTCFVNIFIYTEQETFSGKCFVFQKSIFFYLLFGYLTANFRTFLRGQTLSPNFNHCVCKMFQTKVCQDPCNEVGSLSLTKHLLGFAFGTFGFNINVLLINQVTLHRIYIRDYSEQAFLQSVKMLGDLD